MALAASRPVDVCLQTIYDLNSGIFLPTLLHMPYPNRSVVWRSIRKGVYTPITPRVACFSAPQGMCICSYQPITEMWTVFSPEGMQIDIRRRPESPFTCFYIRSSLDQYLSTDSSV